MENILCGKCGKANDDLCPGCGQCPECHDDLQNVAASMFMKLYEGETLGEAIEAMAGGVAALKAFDSEDDGMGIVDSILSLMRLLVIKLVDGDGEEGEEEEANINEKDKDLFAEIEKFVSGLEEKKDG